MKKQISILFLLIVTLMLVFTSCGIANKKVESIQILSGAPAEVEVGKTPDFSDIKVKVTYNDGQIKEVGYSDVTISTVDTSKVGKVEYTVSYDGASAKASINVKAAGTTITEVQLDSISYLSGIQTEFYEGADFHLTNLKVTAHYSDGSTKTVTYDKLTVKQNIDADTVGEQTLIVSYEGKECRIKITVLKIEAVRLSLVLNGFVNKALIGKSFDTSLITGTVHYNNSSTQNIANADITFSAVDTSSAGQKTLVGTYNGMSAECNVDVLGIKSIEFSGFKTAIKFNEELDLTALTANVIASDNSEYTLAAADITVDKAQFNTTLDGVSQKTTKIFFSYCGSVRDYNITVTAERADATLLSLEYVSGIKTKLFVGEEFNDSSLVATANRTFGFNSVGTLTKADLTVEGTVNTAVAGTYPVTYSLTEGGVTKSFTVNVVVTEPTPTELVLNTYNIGWVVKGEALDTSSITATLRYNYAGKTTQLANSDLTITGVNTGAVGDFELTVSYGGLEKKVAYKVVTATEITGVVGIDGTVSLGSVAYEAGEVYVTVLLSNGESITRTLNSGVEIDSANYDSTAVGTTALTVKFASVQKEITVNVIEVLDELVLEGIAIQPGLVASIFAGDTYDYSLLKITASFNYGITKTYGIANGVVVTTEGTTNTAGTYKIIASYEHEGVTKTAKFTVEVKPVVATELVIGGELDESILIGDSFDTSKITGTLYYNNGTSTPVTNAELAFNIDVSTAGVKTLTVTHTATGMSDTANVTVVGIKSVVFNGVNDRYRVNTQIASSNITISILGTDGKTYVRSVDSNAVIPTLTLDITKTSESKEYVFTYYGVEFKKNIEVYAEFADATLLSVTYTGSERVFRDDSFIDKVSVLAKYTYGFERTYRVSDGVTFEGDVNTALTGNYDFTVSYGGKTANGTVSVVFPKVTGIVINYAPIAIKGENYDFESIHVTVTLENNTTLDATLKDLTDYNITSDLNVAVVGDNTLTLTANGKNYTKTVKVYEIEKIVINTDGFKTIVQLGTTFSTEGLGEIYVYLVGGQAPVIREVSEFNHNVNMNVTGKNYTLTTTYLGVTSEPVKITVADHNFIISGAANPPAIEAWISGTYKDKFLDSGYYYVVGDDNPFKYAIEFQLFDIINNQPGSVGSLEYVGNSIVTLDGVPVGTEYVVIDEVNHTFDFTEAAIGKNFVITTAHKDYSEYTKSLEVSIVDAYNIDEAIELNLLTNFNDTIGDSGKQQMTVLYTFLANNMVAGINDMSYEEYVAFVNGINGIVIHCNMVIAREDLPDAYFFTTASGEKYLWDHQSIYYRVFTEYKFDDPDENEVTPEVFNLYGNYFTVVSNNIPIVAPNGTKDSGGTTTNNDDELSSSQLFAFDIADDVQTYAEENDVFFAENYVLNIYAFGIHDNDPSVAVQPELAAKRSKLGIIGMKFRRGTYNVNSVNAEAYFISMFPDYDDVVVNFDYCTFYNAWNNHIMTWSMNDIDRDGDQYDGSIHKGYTPLTVNVTNSFIGKCGGPVIMANSKNPDKEFNTATSQKQNINIDDKTNIFSYVKGDESWFVAFNATPIVGQISEMNAFFAAQGASYKTLINGNEFMNMIIVNMDSDFNPADPSSATKDVDGSFTIGENVIVDMNDWSDGENNYNYGHGGEIDKNRNYGGNMVFATSSGGVAHLDMSNYTFSADAGNPTEGDYITLYAFNLGIGLGFNEPALDAEPTPADCTVERITELHGIN